jgi:hypothetical protein
VSAGAATGVANVASIMGTKDTNVGISSYSGFAAPASNQFSNPDRTNTRSDRYGPVTSQQVAVFSSSLPLASSGVIVDEALLPLCVTLAMLSSPP